MMIDSPTMDKWFALDYDLRKRVKVGDSSPWIIPDGIFTPEEIEKLRGINKLSIECSGLPIFANFLPDGVRPEGVKKL